MIPISCICFIRNRQYLKRSISDENYGMYILIDIKEQEINTNKSIYLLLDGKN